MKQEPQPVKTKTVERADHIRGKNIKASTRQLTSRTEHGQKNNVDDK